MCYGRETCLVLAPGETRSIHAAFEGPDEVFVHLKGVSTVVSADTTFRTVEVEESCSSLARHLLP